MTLCLALALVAAPLSACWIESATAGEGGTGKTAWRSKRPATVQASAPQTLTAQTGAPQTLAPKTLDVDPQAKPISAAQPVTRKIDPFADPFGDNELSDSELSDSEPGDREPSESSRKSEQAAKRKSGVSDDKGDAQPAGATKKADLPWRDPAVIQVNATLPPIQPWPENKTETKTTAKGWIRPKMGLSEDKPKPLSEDKPRLLSDDASSDEELRSPILPILNTQPAPPVDRTPTTEELTRNTKTSQLEDCPKIEKLTKVKEISTLIRPKGEGPLPPECTLGDSIFQPRNWSSTNYTWKASGLCHKPLYFEQVGVERYGHTFGGPLLSPILQPAVSTAHFFGSALILPYKVGVELPWECVYSLGYYRPGNCAPYSIGPIPLSARGAALEAGVAVGLIFLIP
jgi:hypothetical protein